MFAVKERAMEFLIALGAVAVWILLNAVVLPRMGVQT